MNRHCSYSKMILSCVIGTFVVVGMISVPLVQGWAAKGDLVAVKSEKKMSKPTSITLGKAEIISLPGEVADVMVADSDVVSVEAVQSSKLYVVGQKVGDTNIIALDSNGDVLKKIDIHVTYDLRAIQSMVDDLFPDEQVKIRAIHDQVVLTGTASTPEKASKIADLVTSYVSDLQDMTGEIDEVVSNMLEVRGDQQVTLQVKIIEANRNFVKELGIQTDANDLDELSPTTVFGQSPAVDLDQSASAVLRSGGGVAVANDPAASFRILRDSGIAGIGTLGLFISALEQEDFLSILAEPNLTAISGQQAGFLAGGEFPFPVGRDQVGNLVIDYREFGVSLNFRPVVMSPDRISLQLNTEVSSLDFTNAVPAGDIVVPGLDVRRAETTVEIPSGGSLMIAGLLQSEALEGMSGLPGIKDTPILGDLISSNSFERNETELVIIITAYVAEPFAAEDKAKKVPKQENKPLAKAFANNMRKSFKRVDDAVFDADESYGYILD